MASELSLIGVELLVADLDRALELFRDVLRFEVLHEGPAPHVAGRMAAVDAGSVVLTLLEPAASGDGAVLSERTPRLAQLIVGTASAEDTSDVFDRVVSAGLATESDGRSRFHVPPEAAEGALGMPVALVVTEVVEP
ncbi:MAG: hypothetical protein KDB40_10240 [Acidimicrobiales bacterium]|nr:hypothetical protein [Acidimicrobiales bacterium]MCB9392037.1 hypothetical protein [Acidimicrobiaceae bacterium]